MDDVDTSEYVASPGPRRGNSLLVVAAADGISMCIVLPVLPFLAGRLGAGPFLIGALFAAFSVAEFVATPLWGHLAGRYDVRMLIVCAALIGAAGNLLFAVSSTYLLLLLGRIVAGCGAANTLLAETRVATDIEPRLRTKYLGRLSALQGVGTVTGPLLGSLLVHGGNTAVGLGAMGVSIAIAGYAWVFVASGRAGQQGDQPPGGLASSLKALHSISTIAPLRSLIGLWVVAWACFAGFAAVLPVYLERHLSMSASEYGYLVAISGAVAFGVRGLLLGKLSSRYGERRLVVAGAVCIAASMLTTLIIPSVVWTPLVPLLYALGASLFFPSLMSETTSRAPGEIMGSVVAGMTMATSFGILVGPLLLGASSQIVGQPSPFLAGGALLLAVAFVAARSSRVWTAHLAPDPEAGRVAGTGSEDQ